MRWQWRPGAVCPASKIDRAGIGLANAMYALFWYSLPIVRVRHARLARPRVIVTAMCRLTTLSARWRRSNSSNNAKPGIGVYIGKIDLSGRTTHAETGLWAK